MYIYIYIYVYIYILCRQILLKTMESFFLYNFYLYSFKSSCFLTSLEIEVVKELSHICFPITFP